VVRHLALVPPGLLDGLQVQGYGAVAYIDLNRYLRLIQWQRGDYNGRMLTIRRDDLPPVACILDCQLEQVRARLDSLGLLLVP
jgi:hypothetical protein